MIYQEGFETEGEGVRYVSEGRGKLDFDSPDLPVGFPGPSFWGRKSEVSFVGVRAVAADRRAVMNWNHTIPSENISEDFLKVFDSTVAWLTQGRSTKQVYFIPNSGGTGATILKDRLEAAGFTVSDDPLGPLDTTAMDLIIRTPASEPDVTRYTFAAVPYLSFVSTLHDDDLLTGFGQRVNNLEVGDLTTVGTHPALGGKTGSFPLFVEPTPATFDLMGFLPSGATPVLTYVERVPVTVNNLAKVDQLIAGTLESIKTEGSTAVADIAAGEVGDWPHDAQVPGSPDGSVTYAVVGRGQIQVAAAGTYSFHLGVDDGGRLRIDRNKNGLDAGDNVIVQEDGTGFLRVAADVTFDAAGTYDFEWVSFYTGSNFGSEVSVARGAGAAVAVPLDGSTWQALGDTSVTGDIALNGAIALTTYVI
ncbi:MAG: hypothetical protein FJ405_13755, partial [Verrucomicrobia bacterium]|nr:hypothetical protein [Verrucomicrobiota bacterium]